MRGPKPKGKVKIKWSADFAYAIGLIASDGNLSPDGRHILFTTKDIQLAETFIKALKIDVKIGLKASKAGEDKKYFVVQFGDVLFYEFLETIGLTRAKSKTIGEIKIPEKLFIHFLRGSFDGDGHSYSYFDPRWRSSFMFYIGFSSASIKHIEWLRLNIKKHIGVVGHISDIKNVGCYQLRFAKKEAIIVAKALYKKPCNSYLDRKRLKIKRTLAMIGAQVKKKGST